MLKLNQLEHSNRLRQRLQHNSNLPLQRLKPRHSQLRQKHKLKLSQRHNSLQLSNSRSSSNPRLTQPVTTPATTTEQTITMEARTLMLALERVALAARLRGQPSSEPERIACVARHLQEKTLTLLIRWTELLKAI